MTVEATVLDIIPYDVTHRTPVVLVDGEQLRGCDEFHTIDEFLVGETIDVELKIRGATVEVISDERKGIEPRPYHSNPADLNTWNHFVYGEIVTFDQEEEHVTGTVDAGVDVIPFEFLRPWSADADDVEWTSDVKVGDFVRILAHKLYVHQPLNGQQPPHVSAGGPDQPIHELNADDLVALFERSDELVRKRAFHECVMRDELNLIDALLEAKSKPWRTDAEDWLILDALQRHTDERAITWIIDTLRDDPNPHKRRKAAEALGEYEKESGIDEAIDPLLTILRSAETGDIRYTAARSVGRIGSPSLVARLVALLDEEDPRTRIAALSALGWFEDEGSTQAIIDSLDDSDLKVRLKALWQVQTRESVRSVPPLVRLLREDEEIVRERAANAFQTIGNTYLAQFRDDSDVVEVSDLQQAFDALIESLCDPSPAVRQQAMLALSSHEATRGRLEQVIDESADEIAVGLAQLAIQKLERKAVAEDE